MQEERTCINNERYTRSHISVWIHFDGQKKRRSTKKKMDTPATMNTEQASNVWYFGFLVFHLLQICSVLIMDLYKASSICFRHIAHTVHRTSDVALFSARLVAPCKYDYALGITLFFVAD